ncbi:MAG: hypothetical protein NZ826_02185 [Thermodesulfovibrio sp.]|nr:hypothetical protein [Thermodesulfovibrio sp.]MDW7972796.1 hypothetical protein [Thermodesulfovibrio sp.]
MESGFTYSTIPARADRSKKLQSPYGELIMTGTIRCSKCDTVILKEGACQKCGGLRCYILIYWKKRIYKIRKDKKNGEPLQYLKALDTLLEINRQIRNKKFNIYD